MIDIKILKQQAETSKKLFKEINDQNRIFGKLIDGAMMGAPEKDKPQINKMKLLFNKVTKLAKEGNLDEAQTLIKNFQNGSQNN